MATWKQSSNGIESHQLIICVIYMTTTIKIPIQLTYFKIRKETSERNREKKKGKKQKEMIREKITSM